MMALLNASMRGSRRLVFEELLRRSQVLKLVCVVVTILSPRVNSQSVQPLTSSRNAFPPLRSSFSQMAANQRPSAKPPAAMVFGIPRPLEKDIVVLRNGSRLAGELLTRQFILRMAAGQVMLDVEKIAGVDRGQESSDIEVIATTENDRFSGILLENSILFRIGESEETVRIRREEIEMMLLSVSENDEADSVGSHIVTLKNGDHFRGTVAGMGEPLFTSPRFEQISYQEISTLVFSSRKDPFAMALLKNGDVIRGEIRRDDIEIELGMGGGLKIHPERISIIDFTRGVDGNLDSLGHATAIYISNEEDQYAYSLLSGSLKVTSIKPNSDYYGALHSGDQIVALDGVPYGKMEKRRYRGILGKFTPLRSELIDGVRHQIFVTVKRRGEFLLFRVMRK